MIINKYAWFLKIVLGAKLPYGYVRENTPGREVVYFNETTGEVSHNHPLSTFIRKTIES